MALWSKTQQLPQEYLSQVQTTYSQYGDYFPIEVRHYFAHWIEEQPWKDIDDKNVHHEQYAIGLFNELTKLIENKANDVSLDFPTRLSFQSVAKQFKDFYSSQPMNLVRVVTRCLLEEERLINCSESMTSASNGVTQATLSERVKLEIQQNLEMLQKRTDETDQDLKHMQLIQEKFVIDYQNQAKISANLSHVQQNNVANRVEMERRLKQEKEEMDRQLLASAQQILQQRLALASKHKESLTVLDTLQKRVVDDELISWKRKQQLGGNGAHFDTSMIDILQKWCEALADLIWRNRMQIIKVDLLRQQLPIDVPAGTVDLHPELNPLVTGLLSSLVTSTFIVEQQPPQVLKKDSRFTATVRLLVGGKLNLQLTPPRVKATIISEQQARSMLQNDDGLRRQQKCGDILNNEGPMDYHQHSGQLSITFRNMSLKNIKRADRRGAETVAEEKFCILFSSDFNVGGNELKFQVWTLSLPVIVTVHGNQECQATATYLWDNQFAEPGRIPFQVPDKVPWPDVATMLSTKFNAMTGRCLSDSNLRYLANKLFGTTGQQDFSTAVISWSQFNKENLPGRNFTFWEWFWCVGKLVKEHLKAPWIDGSIIGFMDKTESQDLLMAKPNGTFLLRFSDGTVGGITIAWVADIPEKAGERQVWNLAPFTIKDFQIRGLADRVKDLLSLITLYPDIPKDKAFSKYYSPPSTDTAQLQTPGGYVKCTLINVIDGQPHAGIMDFHNPMTPQAIGDPASPASYSNQHQMMIGSDATSLEIMMDQQSDFDMSKVSLASPDYADEELDFNKINEWIAAQETAN